MKVLYLHQYFVTPASCGGTRSYEMAKRFVTNGHNVTFVTSSAFLTNCYKFNQGWNEFEIDGIQVFAYHLPYSNKDSFLRRILKFIRFSLVSTTKSLSIKADIVLATSTPLTIAIPGLIYSKLKKKPLVFEVRDLWPELPIATGVIKNKVVIKAAQYLEHYTYKNAKRLIGLSPGMCDGIIRHGIESRHVTLATNSCDTSLFDVEESVGKDYLTSSLSFVKKRKLVVYTGTFGLINNVNYMVSLAEKMIKVDPNICFLAVGDGMQKEQIINTAEKKGILNRNFYVMPPIPKTEIVKLLSAADLSLSLFGPVKEMWHNSANKLFDALASNTPIAINYGGWQKDLINEYRCGLVLDPIDLGISSVNISNFLNDVESYNYAKEQCNNLAYNHFSRDIMAGRVEETLKEAVNDKENI
ncbi:glycosyltransferase family 4 protein [Photobacterium sanguinicancri]|uniref:glycosyltransferase family 4 protein n=1 Tax=Photobacterium sanguinicancri TaxID=875932 RepID=UPI003D137529